MWRAFGQKVLNSDRPINRYVPGIVLPFLLKLGELSFISLSPVSIASGEVKELGKGKRNGVPYYRILTNFIDHLEVSRDEDGRCWVRCLGNEKVF